MDVLKVHQPPIFSLMRVFTKALSLFYVLTLFSINAGGFNFIGHCVALTSLE